MGRWLRTDPYGQYHSPYVGMGNNPVTGFDPDGGYTKFGARVARFFYMLGGNSAGPVYQAAGGNRFSYGFNSVGPDGTIVGHFDYHNSLPTAPDWVSNKYMQGFAHFVAGHEMQNMEAALETYRTEGFQAYIYHSIRNASRENSLAFATGGYGPVRGSGSVRVAAKGGSLGNPFKNATLGQVDEAFQVHVQSGKLQLKYVNPKTGAKAYQNTKSGYSYNLDPGGMYGKKLELPHIDVNYANPKPLNVAPKKKLSVSGGF